MEIIPRTNDMKVFVKNWASDLEEEALGQIKHTASLPFIHRHLAVMPDAHAGRGSTIGTVIATKGAIMPAAVGVDIGCGMRAIKLPFKVSVFGDSLLELRNELERSIPVGFSGHSLVSDKVGVFMTDLGPLEDKEHLLKKAALQMGTLGGGNHFIEICQDEEQNAWLMLHSGSRGVGKQLADVHINKAKEIMKQYFISTPNDDLAYLVQDTKEFKAYIKDLRWAQAYAHYNRAIMADIAISVVLKHVKSYPQTGMTDIDCHHNYVAMENHFGENLWITRKGAVSAKAGELGIIPGSMGAKSFIVRGFGNPDSFKSCSHGAGRRMSRTKAKSFFTVDDLKAQTNGVECRKDDGVLDEIPGAYKDIDQVMKNQSDLVEAIHTLKQILCIKG